MTDTPDALTYASVVSRENVLTAFSVALNDLNIQMFDVGDAFLFAKNAEKLYTVAGLEFDEYTGRTLIISRALYGLKSSGAAYRAHFAATLTDLGFTVDFADGYIWLRPAVTQSGEEYYEYLLTYVDDCLVISKDPKAIIDRLKEPPHSYTLRMLGRPNDILVPRLDGTT